MVPASRYENINFYDYLTITSFEVYYIDAELSRPEIKNIYPSYALYIIVMVILKCPVN